MLFRIGICSNMLHVHIHFSLLTPSQPCPSASATLPAKLPTSSSSNSDQMPASLPNPALTLCPLAFLERSFAFACSFAIPSSACLRRASSSALGKALGDCCSACLRAARSVRRASRKRKVGLRGWLCKGGRDWRVDLRAARVSCVG